MRRCRERLTEQVAERPAAGGGGVFFLSCGDPWLTSEKRQRGAPTAAGSASGLASCRRGRWFVLTIGGIEPPLLGYESMHWAIANNVNRDRVGLAGILQPMLAMGLPLTCSGSK